MYTSHELPLYHRELLACIRTAGRSEILDDQHTTGYWLHQQLVAHRARVWNAQHATLVVVPFWMKVSWMVGTCNDTDHLSRVRHMLQVLNATAQFRRHPRRHLLLSSSFMARQPPATSFAHQRGVRTKCIGAWVGKPIDWQYFPRETTYEHMARRLTISHMERYWPQLCNELIPATNRSLYSRWPPPWWGSRTLVLPYVVDARTTRAAQAHERKHFDYKRWTQRPYSIFFAGNIMRIGGAVYVRLALSSLNAWEDARIHCSGNDTARWFYWLQELQDYDIAVDAVAGVRRAIGGDDRGSTGTALRGSYCRPPITKHEVLETMRRSKFCLCPRGDSPSMSRVYFAMSVGCIPIIVSNPWTAMAAPFPGLFDFFEFALHLPEADAIRSPLLSAQRLLESTEARVVEESGRKWLHVPPADSPAAQPLRKRLAAMHRMHRAALWGLKGNELIANLTLMSAWELVYQSRLPTIGLEKESR